LRVYALPYKSALYVKAYTDFVAVICRKNS
jgi:hypothetical protein